MENLINLSNEEICDFLLNNKQADALELGVSAEITHNSSFKERTIYADKSMRIVYSYLKLSEDDIIEQFYIFSSWWGKIKNSFFTLRGFKGKITDNTRCGVINKNDLKEYNSYSNVSINNTNKNIDVEIIDFASLTLFCQKKYGKSPTYFVVDIVSESPNPWVKIEIEMPDGNSYFNEGASKKEAANKFAVNYKC